MDSDSLVRAIRAEGFAFVPGSPMREVLSRSGPLNDWPTFAASWGDLAIDTFMADRGKYRRRRHAAFSIDAAAITRLPHQPHFQAREYNALNGGIERWFEPILPAIADGATLQTILGFCAQLFGALAPGRRWLVEVHQFRIEARAGAPGLPTPEGVHRDGVDYVLVLLVGRVNIASGTTTIHRPDGAELGSFTLAAPLDSALLDDSRVSHGVTAVEPVDPAVEAHRDVLVVTFRAS
jgi:hypothetical protein